MDRRSRSVGEVALRSQLGAAHQKINNLEVFIRDREKHFQTSLSRTHHGDHQRDSIAAPPPSFPGFTRRRRTGRMHDTLMTLRMSGASFDEGADVESEALLSPLGQFVCLKLVKVNESDGETSLPFILRRLIGREYHIGPDGVTIGTSPTCDIMLPVEGDIVPEHCCIKHVKSSNESNGAAQLSNRFVLEDLTNGHGTILVTRSSDNDEDVSDATTKTYSFTRGVQFVTGKLVWNLVALPEELAFRANVFHLAKNGCLAQIKDVLETPSIVPKLTITGIGELFEQSLPICSLNSVPSFDINAEYKPPFYEEDEKFNMLLSSRKGSERISVVNVSAAAKSTAKQPSLLLHIAISNGDLEMVTYFLDKGADVNKCCGDLQYTSAHLAAFNNNTEIMSLLMKYGADMEIRNTENLTPIALTSSYDIRKMILNSVLLCAAADAGDLPEVTRLLGTSHISPRVKGLRHKSALHVAAFQGHVEVMELLIMNGADVNQKGGTRHRTPLHYASQGGHTHCIQLLLSAGAHEFIRDIGGYTPLNLCKGDACKILNRQPLSLCLAVQSGDIEAVTNVLEDTQLSEEELNIINLRNENGHAPLHLASIIGSLPIAQVLVSFGATVDLSGGRENWTPLCYSAMAGHVDLVEFYLSVGANPEACDSQGKSVRELVKKEIEETNERMQRLKQRERSESVVQTSFLARLSVNMLRQESSPSCSVESELSWQNTKLDKLYQVLPLLTSLADKLTSALDSGNIFEFVSILGNSTFQSSELLPILLQACEDGLVSFVRAILDHDVDPCVDGPSDEVPLLVAAKNGHDAVVKLLVEHGANPDTQSIDTLSTALHEATSMNELVTVKYLLSAGANKDMINSAGEKPFDLTKMSEIQELLATGANLLLVAASTNDSAVVTHLVTSKGISVDSQFYHNGHTALHEACELGFLDVVKTLMELGANVNKKGGVSLSTPLHIASEYDHLEIAKLFLVNQAKVDIKNTFGKVPFEIATSNKMRKVLVESRTIKPLATPSQGKLSSDENSKLCVICMDKPVNTIILPCGHQSFCIDCATQLSECALDRKTIREVIPVYK